MSRLTRCRRALWIKKRNSKYLRINRRCLTRFWLWETYALESRIACSSCSNAHENVRAKFTASWARKWFQSRKNKCESTHFAFQNSLFSSSLSLLRACSSQHSRQLSWETHWKRNHLCHNRHLRITSLIRATILSIKKYWKNTQSTAAMNSRKNQ